MSLRTMHRGASSRSYLLVIAAAALAAGAGLYVARHSVAPGPGNTGLALPATMQPKLRAVRLIAPPRTLPAYRLRLSDGGVATPATLQGRWTLVYLGFSHCPDVCPTTLQLLAKAQQDWKALPETRRPRLLFVSVDPERDTPAIVGDYAHYFSPDTLAASPAPEELARFAQAIGLVYLKVPDAGAGGGYSMDHSATLVLLDPQGRQAGLLRPPFDPRQIADDLRLLAETAP